MKNKLLVSVFAAVIVFAFTACETKSNVTDVCTDMVKQSMHKSPRSLVELDGQVLTISEYEFLGGVDDNRLVYRTISYGNGVSQSEKILNATYEYGAWNENNTAFSLFVTGPEGPYTLWYKGNAFITPDGRAIGGESTDNVARVEKWKKTIASFPNTEWEATFQDEFIRDSVYKDSIKTTFIPPMTFRYDTIRVYAGYMDTLNADTTCYYRFSVNREGTSNTGHFYKKEVRSKYDKKTKEVTIISEREKEYDCIWFFSDVSSDAKFSITLQSVTPNVEGDMLNISKYKVDEAGVPTEFLQGGLTFKRPELP